MSAEIQQGISDRSGIMFRVGIALAVGLILFVGAVLVAHKAGPGDNYLIYKYMSEYRNNNGQYPPVDPGLDPNRDLRSITRLPSGAIASIDPAFHDYTPMNSYVYRAIFSVIDPAPQQVFIAYQVVMVVIGLLVLIKLIEIGILPSDLFFITIVFLICNPLIYRLLGADDKAGFLMWPLICILAANCQAYWGAVAVGIFAGWAGLGVAAIPVLPSLARSSKVQAFALPAIAVLLFLVMMFVGGEESRQALANRAHREFMTPFLNSIWRWFPDWLWPGARYPVLLAFIGTFSLLAWLGRIRFALALIATGSTYLLFSNNTVPSRIIFFVPLLAACFASRRARLGYSLFAFVAIAVSHGLRRLTGDFDPDPTIGVALCNAVILVPLVAVLLQCPRTDCSV